jgi:integrase
VWALDYQFDVTATGSVIKILHPHMFRHTFAQRWLCPDGTEGDLMRLAGWPNRKMLDRVPDGS